MVAVKITAEDEPKAKERGLDLVYAGVLRHGPGTYRLERIDAWRDAWRDA